MEILKNPENWENVIKRDDASFLKFEKMLFRFFNFKEKFKNNKEMSLLSITFKEDYLYAKYKSYLLWFEDGVRIYYDRIIKQVQIYLTKKYHMDDFIFGEKINNKEEVIYYVKIKNKEQNQKVYFENKIKINLYLSLYEEYLIK